MKSAIAAAYAADKTRRFRVEEAKQAVSRLQESDQWIDRHGPQIIEARNTITRDASARVRKVG